jgi:transcription termination/antitermination protein NusA
MSPVRYDNESLKLMSLFEKITRTSLKDSFIDDNGLLTFIVKEGQLGKAVGKKAVNVRKLENMLNRKIKILEFNSNIINFIKNLIYPLKAKGIKQEGEEIIIEGPDTKTKGLLIGKNAKNLRNTEEVVKKYFDIKEIKII